MSEKNKNNMPWEGASFDLAKVIRWGIVCLVAVLLVAFGYWMTTPDATTTAPQIGVGQKMTLDELETPIGSSVSVEDLGYKELVIDYVDENGEKVYSSELTWVMPGDRYLVKVPSVFGCVPTTEPYFLTMGDTNQVVEVRYLSTDYLSEHLMRRPSLEALQAYYVSRVYDENGDVIELEEDQDFVNGENTRYLPRANVELPDAVYVDDSLTDRYVELDDGQLYVDREGENGTYLIPAGHF